jgi:hypothetical protein
MRKLQDGVPEAELVGFLVSELDGHFGHVGDGSKCRGVRLAGAHLVRHELEGCARLIAQTPSNDQRQLTAPASAERRS